MDIVIVAQYLRDIENFDENNSRFVYLAKMLRDRQHTVEIVTSDFHHSPKVHFATVGKLQGIKITALHEPGYPKNISLKRFSSHKILAKNIQAYLEGRKKPDVVYAAIPSLAVVEACANYCRANHNKFVVDMQDLWPEAFKMVVKIPFISDVAFYPMKRQADKIYAAADEIIAVSKTYAERGMKVNKKCKDATVAFLGTDKEVFDQYVDDKSDFTNDVDTVRVAYIGSLSRSYDIECAIDALSKVQTTKKVQFLIMGDGPLRGQFESYAESKKIDYRFTGALPYPQMVEALVKCDIAVNPIRKGSAGSIINKVGDYAMAGLPVVNSQECQEYRELLDSYDAGINCECENADDMAVVIEQLVNDSALRKRMGINSKKFGEEKIDRGNSYKSIISAIER
jgi:glycosyltransferase involved in cell wall biosynthesis